MKTYILFPVLLVLLSSCTSNPFGDDGISEGRRSMSGRVLLDDESGLEDVYVWLEDFDISTRTDAEGHFSLTLPPPASQSPTGGLNGVFRVYFYMANFLLESFEVLLQDGEFRYGEGALNNEGSLITPVEMNKFLEIKSRITPAVVPRGFDQPIGAEVQLHAIMRDSVSVVYPNSTGGLLGAVFLRELGTGQIHILKGAPGNDDKVVVGENVTSRVLVFDLQGPTGGLLPVGHYEVIPYILVAHEPIPPELIQSLGNDVQALTEDYLKIPFQRDLAIFQID